MPISVSRLRQEGQYEVSQKATTLSEARQLGLRTAFLCHSHQDQQLVRGFVRMAQRQGWNIYVDWMDATMPPTPNRETADRIKARIVSARLFLFLATRNSTASRWCPWEIGYADGKKSIEDIYVITTRDDDGTSRGNEYLQLYKHIDLADDGRLAAWNPGAQRGAYVETL